MRVFEFDLVDEIDAEIAVHRLVAQDVLVLLARSGHLVLPAHRQDLHEAHVEEEALHDAGEDDQALEQVLVGFGRAGLERRVGQHVDERDQEVVLVLDRLDLVVRVEDLAFVEPQALRDVLVGVRVDRLLERLAQQVLPALGRGDVAIRAEHDVVGGERVGGDEEAQVALDDQALILGQAVGVLPQLDVALHVDLLRHPVVGAAGQVLVPRPAILERDQLIDVRGAVDDALVLEAHTVEVFRHGFLLHVDVVHRLLREHATPNRAHRLGADGLRRARRQARLGRRRWEIVVETQHGASPETLFLYCVESVQFQPLRP